MASLNTSHQQDGGVILYRGELILLYCDQVNCDVSNKGSAKGRIYLTTHRVIFTAQPLTQDRNFQSLSAPFFAMFDLSLEQPVFGANYIKGKVRTDSSTNTSATDQNQYIFKLKFNKGGAIEFGQALREAARRTSSSPTPQEAFSAPSTFSEYYQAPDSAYQPNYPVGFTLPTQTFSQAPPPGFVYMQQAPPPYPGLVTVATQTQTYAPACPIPNTFPGFTPSAQYPLYPVGEPQYTGAYQPPYNPQGYVPQAAPNSFPQSPQHQNMQQAAPPSYSQVSGQEHLYPGQSMPPSYSDSATHHAYPSYPPQPEQTKKKE